MSDSSPLSPKGTNPAKALWFVIPFGLCFAGIGFVALWFVTLKPALRSAASADWPAVECRILSSELDSKRGSKGGTNYRAIIRYRYEWAGETFESERYDFADGYTNLGVERMRRAVAAHEPGDRAVCYVDPEEPALAVLERSVPKSVWIGCFLALFPIFGLVFIVASLRAAWRARAAVTAGDAAAATPLRASLSPAAGPGAAAPEPVAGEVVLKPAGGRFTTFLFLAVFALFWNGVIFFICLKEFRGFRGLGDWLGFLFLVPFALVGLLMLGLALHAFSRLFAPAVELRLDPSRLRLAERVPFSWRLGARGVRRLVVRLSAREETTFRQGKNRRTERADFHRVVVFESTDPLGLNEGRGELALPDAGVVPSLEAGGDRIVWEIRFTGEIPWRADVDDAFPLAVRGPQDAPLPPAAPEPREFAGAGATLWTVDRLAPEDVLVFTLHRAATAAPGPLTVRLGWFAQGKGEGDAGLAWSQTITDLAPGGDRGFEVKLPAAPWSFHGSLLTLGWRLEVLDAKETLLVAAPLVVAPRGEAVQLPALPPEESSFQARKRAYQARRRTR